MEDGGEFVRRRWVVVRGRAVAQRVIKRGYSRLRDRLRFGG